MFSDDETSWKYKERDGRGDKPFWWFSLPHIDSQLLGGNQHFIWRDGWLKNQDGNYYMIPNPGGGSRLWFGIRPAEYLVFEGKSWISSPESPIYAKVEYIPEDCLALEALGISPNRACEFFENYWNCYMIDYTQVLDENGPVINKYGNPEKDKFTRLMTPEETTAYCKGWIRALCDFPETGMAIVGHEGSRQDVIDHFARLQSFAETASKIYSLGRPSLPKIETLCLPP